MTLKKCNTLNKHLNDIEGEKETSDHIAVHDYATNTKKVNVSITGCNEPVYSFIEVKKLEGNKVHVLLL